jgi:pimeloyl-ACP methyl ester carboxylesterase
MGAYQVLPKVHAPTLILQGTQDDLVQPKLTRQLSHRLPHLRQYVEVHADHNLISPQSAAWSQVERLTLDFARNVIG